MRIHRTPYTNIINCFTLKRCRRLVGLRAWGLAGSRNAFCYGCGSIQEHETPWLSTPRQNRRRRCFARTFSIIANIRHSLHFTFYISIYIYFCFYLFFIIFFSFIYLTYFAVNTFVICEQNLSLPGVNYYKICQVDELKY